MVRSCKKWLLQNQTLNCVLHVSCARAWSEARRLTKTITSRSCFARRPRLSSDVTTRFGGQSVGIYAKTCKASHAYPGHHHERVIASLALLQATDEPDLRLLEPSEVGEKNVHCESWISRTVMFTGLLNSKAPFFPRAACFQVVKLDFGVRAEPVGDLDLLDHPLQLPERKRFKVPQVQAEVHQKVIGVSHQVHVPKARSQKSVELVSEPSQNELISPKHPNCCVCGQLWRSYMQRNASCLAR